MKSNLCVLPQSTEQLSDVFIEVEKCAAYNGLSPKQSLQLRLLAEELAGMLPALLKISEGLFWLENEGNHYELHVKLTTFFGSIAQRDKLLSVSTSGKNAAAVGIMGKIRCIVEEAMLAREANGFSAVQTGEMELAPGGWSLANYRLQAQIQNRLDQWDELEKSIIANLADDVKVAICGEHVEITIIKTFWEK